MIKVKHEGNLLINLMKYRPSLVDDVREGFIIINCTLEQWPNIKKDIQKCDYWSRKTQR